jgi:hypothetical protein
MQYAWDDAQLYVLHNIYKNLWNKLSVTADLRNILSDQAAAQLTVYTSNSW